MCVFTRGAQAGALLVHLGLREVRQVVQRDVEGSLLLVVGRHEPHVVVEDVEASLQLLQGWQLSFESAAGEVYLLPVWHCLSAVEARPHSTNVRAWALSMLGLSTVCPSPGRALNATQRALNVAQ